MNDGAPLITADAAVEGETIEAWASDLAPNELGRKTAHGALVSVGAQVCTLVLRTGSLALLARLLVKEDFGLVNMATTLTGFLTLFRDAGLSMATVRALLDHEGTDINPVLAEPRARCNSCPPGRGRCPPARRVLSSAASLLGHSRFRHDLPPQRRSSTASRAAAACNGVRRLAMIDTGGIIFSIIVGVTLAWNGYQYWALVAMNIAPLAVGVPAIWLFTGWTPTRPEWRSEVKQMVAYGGAITANNIVAYFAYNLDKVLVGRFCGCRPGIYGRAYQLITLPNDTLYNTVGSVAFPALSRVQNNAVLLKSFFLKTYGLFLSVVLPVTTACALFAEDIILLFLGPKWQDTAVIFRLLAPTILALALINPFGWLLMATGHANRSLKIALSLVPALTIGYYFGLKHGIEGIAIAFSLTMVLAVLPIIMWAKSGTLLTLIDLLKAVAPSVTSIVLAVLFTLSQRRLLSHIEHLLLRLTLECALLFGIYAFLLLVVMGQGTTYMKVLRDIRAGNKTDSDYKLVSSLRLRTDRSQRSSHGGRFLKSPRHIHRHDGAQDAPPSLAFCCSRNETSLKHSFDARYTSLKM